MEIIFLNEITHFRHVDVRKSYATNLTQSNYWQMKQNKMRKK